MNVVAQLVNLILNQLPLEATTVWVQSWTQLFCLSRLVTDACRRVRPAPAQCRRCWPGNFHLGILPYLMGKVP